ncbi:MAG: Uma2 family endonuclease [Chloroflexota bacterium]|nr:Uma2 family endonuclease [Chloroflexota bacterium]MDE2959785.1 Uma2 family endonuclease [Chloroflexota bacterium]
MATTRSDVIRRFSAAEREAMVAAGIVAAGEREAVGAGRRFTVDEYLALTATGILAKEERIELLDGEIICMAPIGNRHQHSVDWVAHLMGPAIGDRAMVRVQGSIQLDDASMPEPDIAVIRLRSVNDITPVLPPDVYLIVEVADSSLEFDLGEKMARYAAAVIPEVWIANLRAGELVVNTGPEGAAYANVRVIPLGGTVSPQAFPDVVLQLADFIPAVDS